MLRVSRDIKSDITESMEENPAWTIKHKEALFGLKSSSSENYCRLGEQLTALPPS